MDLGFELLLKMTGLYLCIALGFYAARKLEIEGKGISRLLFYIIVPLMFLGGISKAQIEQQYLLLPVFIFLISCTLSLGHYHIARRMFHDKSANILAFTSGNGNLGYFGIPVAALLFEPDVLGIYMMMIIGTMLYETTLGYYITTKGDFSTREALQKMIRLPMLHGALIGLLLSLLETPLPHFLEGFFTAISGAYSTLGMMMVGIALAGVTSLKLDWKFISMAFAVKFIAWPLMVLGLIALDSHVMHLFNEDIHHVALLLSFMPLAVNSVIFATLLEAEPEKMASAVFLSTAFALFFVPAMVSWLIL
ncbi:MAG: AEC family transporter [Rickettsiales bacterium]|nr:AEC family transporter [Rickettsiales bacterium]